MNGKITDEFYDCIKVGEVNGKVLYFLEIGIYSFIGKDRDCNRLKMIRNVLKDLNIVAGLTFEKEYDFAEYLRRDPPVIETNKSQGKAVPHPSFATILSEQNASLLLQKHLNSPLRGNDSTNEILIMPVKSNVDTNQGHSTPMFPMPQKVEDQDLSFFILFLGSAIERGNSSVESEIENIRNHHRTLYQYSLELGGKRYSYDTITNEIRGQDQWKAHYGEELWSRIIEMKQKYDPFHTFCSVGVDMFD